ncbi:hypothetical protein [Sessilibacter sp. MAH4]
MKNPKSGRYVKRDSTTGKFIVKSDHGRSYTAIHKGVSASDHSTRKAKTTVKETIRYNSNVGFIVKNDRVESKSAASVSSKSQSHLENKYKNISAK